MLSLLHLYPQQQLPSSKRNKFQLSSSSKQTNSIKYFPALLLVCKLRAKSQIILIHHIINPSHYQQEVKIMMMIISHNINQIILFLNIFFLCCRILLMVDRYMMLNLPLLSFVLVVCSFQLEVVVDYSKQPYTALRDALGKNAIENSDNCDDKLHHITAVKDPILNRMVHHYSLHVHQSYVDGDRCSGDYSRQRCETSVQPTSPSWMYGAAGKTFTYAWKLYLESDFKASNKFCHLHQIKLDGSDVGNPNLTLTARSNVQLQNEGKVIAQVPLASFKGVWIQIREKITFNAEGCVEFTAHRMRDGYLLMSYKGCDVKLNNMGRMIRPKFGFYRSLEDTASLRDESIRIADLCIGENDSCHYDQNGNKHSPAPSLTTN